MFEELNNEELMEFEGGGILKFLGGSIAGIFSLGGTAIGIVTGVATGSVAAGCWETTKKCFKFAVTESEGRIKW